MARFHTRHVYEVDKYDWERRVKTGSGTAGSGSEADTSETVSSLTPGTTYEWSASAWIGSYQSPWTSWIPFTQAKPNVDAGEYFDGDSTDTVDLNFEWTGTAENSTSTATASGVKGWGTASPGNAGAPVVYRITGGIHGGYAARVQITADMGQRDQLRQAAATSGIELAAVLPQLRGNVGELEPRVDRVLGGRLDARPRAVQQSLAEVVAERAGARAQAGRVRPAPCVPQQRRTGVVRGREVDRQRALVAAQRNRRVAAAEHAHRP
jgi:hypothetical protein